MKRLIEYISSIFFFRNHFFSYRPSGSFNASGSGGGVNLKGCLFAFISVVVAVAIISGVSYFFFE
jgi:hypothetical protein